MISKQEVIEKFGEKEISSLKEERKVLDSIKPEHRVKLHFHNYILFYDKFQRKVKGWRDCNISYQD